MRLAELRHDMAVGNYRAAQAERAEIAARERDVRADQRDVRHDTYDIRHDRRDMHRDGWGW